MDFVSLTFYPCLALAALLFYLLPARFRPHYALLLSYGFYATWSPLYLVMLIGETLLVYFVGLKIADTQQENIKKNWMFVGLAATVGLIVFFKAQGALQGWLVPLGVSYYSFKLIAYIVEVYWDDAALQRDPVLFALYPAFFPQIVSGPIQRSDDFFAQIKKAISKKADYAQIEDGFRCILGGLMLKLLIGDRLGSFIEIVDKNPTDYKWSIILTTVACYTLQLYADFAGYTNIAIGIGKIFGINSPPNFMAPLAAPNIQEMWKRWHISLTSWITDYLFLPLQMMLRSFGKIGGLVCIASSMALIGVWHAFTLNFLVFGLCHAAFLIITTQTENLRNKLFGKSTAAKTFRYATGIALTFVLMTFSQMFWHTETWQAAITHIKLLFGVIPSGSLTMADIRTDIADPVFVCMAIAFFVGAGAPGMKRVATVVDRFVPTWVQYGLCLLVLSALTLESGIKFIYGQF